MRFPLFFLKSILRSKSEKEGLSRKIVLVGRISVALVVAVSLIALGTGLGAKKAIMQKMEGFHGNILVQPIGTPEHHSSKIDRSTLQIDSLRTKPYIRSVQAFANISGIIREKKNFAGIVLKGVSKGFDKERFLPFLKQGNIPDFGQNTPSNMVLISQKIAHDLQKKQGDSLWCIFFDPSQTLPAYRQFQVAGIYQTDIKFIDEHYIIGDLQHVQKMLHWSEHQVGGYEIFLKNPEKITEYYPEINQLVGFNQRAKKYLEIFPQIRDWVEIFDTNIMLILGIMLFVVVVNIVMVLLILIVERANSIGILKTLGASNYDIQLIFISYTLLIILPGIALGNLIGIGCLSLQKYLKIITLDPDSYFVSTVPIDFNLTYFTLLSLGVLLISGIMLLLPSYMVGKVSPIKSIKISSH